MELISEDVAQPFLHLQQNFQDGEFVLTWDGNTPAFHYSLERSGSNDVFEQLTYARLVCNNSSCVFTDPFPQEGLSYYRVTAQSGTQTVHSALVPLDYNYQPRFVLEMRYKESVRNLEIKMKSEEHNEAALVILYDVYGNEKFSKIIISNQDSELLVSSGDNALAPGIYYIVASNERSYFKHKLIIS